MKKLLFIALMGVLLIGCTKATDSNLRGKWVVKTIRVNGTEYPPISKIVLEFLKDGVYKYYDNDVQTDMGVWSLDKKNQILTFDNLETWTINEKKGDKLEMQQVNDTETFIYYFEKE